MQYRCEILREFERLEPNLEKVDLEDVLSNGLKKYSKPILSLLKPKKKATFLQEVETTLNHFRPADQRKYEENCLTLAGILLLFQEKPEDLIKFQLDDECPIYILAKDKLLSMGEEEFAVYGEGCKLLGCEKFFQASYFGLIRRKYMPVPLYTWPHRAIRFDSSFSQMVFNVQIRNPILTYYGSTNYGISKKHNSCIGS